MNGKKYTLVLVQKQLRILVAVLRLISVPKYLSANNFAF
jgi:hypothetical protein